MAVDVRPPASRARPAFVSIVSNTLLIALKLAAGAITGSVAILSEAIHSGIDLIASIVAFTSIRKADEPADDTHPYGHGKLENLSAQIEGMLILIGAGVIIFEAVSHLIDNTPVESIGIGIAVVGFSAVTNFGVSGYLRRHATATGSPALAGDAAHLRTDAYTSLGVLVGLVLVKVTGYERLDPIVALVVAFAILRAGLQILTTSSRALVDETLPADELDAIRETVHAFGPSGVAGSHKLRARRAGTARHVDLHVQFRAGTTLEDAHRVAHELQDAISLRLGGADILIHLEPEDRVQPGTEIPETVPHDVGQPPPLSAG